MTPEQLQQIQQTVQEAVKVTVNGKIDRLNEKVEQHIIDHKEIYTEFLRWKEEEIKPMTDVFKGRRYVAAQTVNIALIMGGIGGFMAGIYEIFRNIKL